MLNTHEYEIIMDCLLIEINNLEEEGYKGCVKWKQLKYIYSKVRIEQLKANPSISELSKIIGKIGVIK